jgi:heparanase
VETQLGNLAPTHAFQARQAFVGGYYELVDHVAMIPNPDYWTALVWKRTMGAGVLNASSSSHDVLAWAHCAEGSGSNNRGNQPGGVIGATFALINLSADSAATLTFSGVGASVPRNEYLLTPVDGVSNARAVLLNGAPLTFEQGVLSPTPPRVVTDPTVPFILPPHTYAFVSFPDASTSC